MPSSSPRFRPELRDQDKHPPRCPACGHDTPETVHPCVEEGFEILRCPDCGLGRTWPPEPAERIAAWYPPSYYGDGNVRFNAVFEHLVLWFRRRRAAVLHNRVPYGPVLDVGCGRGLLLDFLRGLGYEPHGVEFSETAAWRASNVLKLPVTTEDFASAPREKDRYNAVIFWHSLEHFSNPVAAVSRAHQALKPGGMLVVAIPNYGSWQARVFDATGSISTCPPLLPLRPASLEAVLVRHRSASSGSTISASSRTLMGCFKASTTPSACASTCFIPRSRTAAPARTPALHYPSKRWPSPCSCPYSSH